MPALQQRDRETVRSKFDAELKKDISLTLFTQANIGLYVPGRECRSCGPTQELIEEVSSLSPRIHLKVEDFYKNPEKAAELGVERIPALVIGTSGRGKARFYGMPSGHEFPVLLESMTAAADNQSRLQLETRRQLRRLPEDVHIQVFVTPNCQYCPSLARVAHLMAMESSRVTADVVEIQEFPDLGARYSVMGVPKTVINDRIVFTGAVPEDVLLQRMRQAIGAENMEEEIPLVSDQTTPIA